MFVCLCVCVFVCLVLCVLSCVMHCCAHVCAVVDHPRDGGNSMWCVSCFDWCWCAYVLLHYIVAAKAARLLVLMYVIVGWCAGGFRITMSCYY